MVSNEKAISELIELLRVEPLFDKNNFIDLLSLGLGNLLTNFFFSI